MDSRGNMLCCGCVFEVDNRAKISRGSAALFFGIGIYAQKSKKPMHFWAGVPVEADKITDVPAYNRENGRMWRRYSIWYWLAGLAWLWSSTAAVVMLFVGCGVGTVLLVRRFLKIERKYRAG